jgi:hypothetical protein
LQENRAPLDLVPSREEVAHALIDAVVNRRDGYVVGYDMHLIKTGAVRHAMPVLGIGFGALLLSILCKNSNAGCLTGAGGQ